MAHPPNARRAAARLVSAVLDERRTLDDALAETAAFNALSGRDRAFARAIASATLRRLGGIDAVLAHFLAKPLPDTAIASRALLRTAAAQLLAMGAAPHAVVSETVTLANAERGARGFAGLMNAVLRKVATDGPALLDALPAGADLPDWLYTRWRAAYGADTAAAIAAGLHAEAPLDLSVKADAAQWAERLGGALLETGGVRLTDPGPIPELPGFEAGDWWVQDAAASLPILMLGEVAGARVLDLCAAPGGKTLQLAAAGAEVTALDIQAERLEIVRANLSRTQLNASLIAADALTWAPRQPADAVLLDAPCTATGTLRRHPDAAWLRRPSDVSACAALQQRLFAAAAAMLKPGGRLVYAVCSLEPEEGPGVWSAAADLGLAPAPLNDPRLAPFQTDPNAIRTGPDHWRPSGGMDGFQAAAFTKTA
jgi:16S rRNA (cytosine967-C5)-methyltransferase